MRNEYSLQFLCFFVLLVSGNRSLFADSGQFEKQNINHFLDSLQHASDHRSAQLSSFELPYVIAVHRTSQSDGKLELEQRTKHTLVFSSGKWAEDIQGLLLQDVKDADQIQEANVRHRYDGLIQRSEFSVLGASSSHTGHIRPNETRTNSMNYFVFGSTYAGLPAVDYLREHSSQIKEITVHGDMLHVVVQKEDADGERVEMVFDTEKDLVLTEAITTDSEGNVSHRKTSYAFVDGVWIPVAGVVENSAKQDNALELMSRIELEPVDLESVEIGKTYLDENFTLQFAKGAAITDFSLGGLRYTLDDAVDQAVLDAVVEARADFYAFEAHSPILQTTISPQSAIEITENHVEKGVGQSIIMLLTIGLFVIVILGFIIHRLIRTTAIRGGGAR